MKKLCLFLFLLSTVAIACNMPKADQTIAMMDRYWIFYKDKQYDSLKAFYLSNGEIFGATTWKAFYNIREKNGDVTDVRLTNTTVGKSFEGGESIKLIYQIRYEKNVINHELTFKKDDKGTFRISQHECTQ